MIFNFVACWDAWFPLTSPYEYNALEECTNQMEEYISQSQIENPIINSSHPLDTFISHITYVQCGHHSLTIN